MPCTAGVTELAERLGFDLTDSLTGNVKFLADLLQRPGTTVVQPETELDNVLLSGGKGVQFFLDHLDRKSVV